MEELIFTPIVLLVGLAIHAFVRTRHDEEEQVWLDRGFAAHVLSSFGQVLLYTQYYDGGDLTAYHYFGVPIAEALRSDFNSFFPETLRELFLRDSKLPFEYVSGGSSSTMSMIAVYLLFMLGNSLYAASLVIAIGSYVGKVLMYRALRVELAQSRRQVLIGCLLVPSAVFWTSTLLKEPVMMVFFGPLFLAARYVIDGRRLGLAALLLIVGGGGVALIKPYVLFAFVVGMGVWVLWQRVLKDGASLVVKPLYIAIGTVLLLGSSLLLDRFMPQTQERGGLGGALAYQRRAALTDQGASNFNLEGADRSADSTEGSSLTSQLALAPIALVTSLFRPFIFEARSPVQLANAFETTWVLWVVIALVRRFSWRAVVRELLASPTLMFCATFTLIIALGTGLATSNMGTLSRYRAPMMPFFVVLLLVLRAQLSRKAEAERSANGVLGRGEAAHVGV